MNAQELIIGHLLPIAATAAVLWLVYRFLFRNSNRLYFNRFFLLTSMLLALAMPLLGLLSGIEVPQMATLKQNMFNGMMLNEVIVTPDGQPVLPEVSVTTNTTPSRFSIWQVMGGIYLLGVGVMTLLFLIKLGRLLALIIRSPKRKMDGCTAVYLSAVPEPVEGPTPSQQGSFSFFRYAFFPNENVDPDIMRHELSHIEHHHSWDILFAEVMMILQWFNPFIYLYKKELQSLHEYQADRDVVATGVDKKNYMMLILQQCTAVDFSGMSNNFSLILTKKRIKMITRNEKAKGLWWRLLATLPVLAILMIANTKVTAQEKQVNPNPPVDTDTYQIVMYEYDDEDRIPVNDTVLMNEDGSYTEIKREPEVDPETGKMRTKVSFATYDKDGKPAPGGFHIKSEPGEGDDVVYRITPQQGFRFPAEPDNDSIYQIVEDMPKFPGGEKALMDYVSNNVKYPEEAKNKNIAGRVFVSFVVEKDGSVSNVKVLRSIGGGCDEEAVRVIKSMPKWKPGMQKGKPVRVNFQMPFVFKLDESAASKSGLANSTYTGTGTGKKDGINYTMKMVMEFESPSTGYFVMTLTSQKKNEKAQVEFEDVGLPFTYTFDGKSSGSIQPTNPDGSQLGEEPMAPYGFIVNKDGSIQVSLYDMKEDIGVEKMVFKKVVK